jgi:hypothetical protein
VQRSGERDRSCVPVALEQLLAHVALCSSPKVEPVRRFAIVCVIVAGGLLGLLSAAEDDWGTKVVMMAIGVLVGTAIGGGLLRSAARSGAARSAWLDEPNDHGSPEDELVRNHWRDRGHPPFAKPPETLPPDRHAFDPDKSG